MEKEPIKSAGLATIDERERILLVAKNHKGVRMPPGWIYQTKGFPKGDVENGESKREGAIREAREETGARIGQLFVPKRKELITYTNYKMGKDGNLDMQAPKEISLFGAYTTQERFVPPKEEREKHPFASLVKIEKFDKHVHNPFDREAMKKIIDDLLEIRKEARKAIKRKRMKYFVSLAD